jgi:hypothetical protein
MRIKIISYMDIRTCFHLLCNYSQTYLLIKITPSPQKNPKTFSFPTVPLFAMAVYMDMPKRTYISRYS